MSSLGFRDTASDWESLPEWNAEEVRVPTLAKFAEHTSLHGLSYVVGPRSCSVRRCLWTVAFFSSLFILIYHYVSLIEYYFQYPHITKVEEVAVNDMDFPAITFCNMNRARITKLSHCDMAHVGELWSLSEDTELDLAEMVHEDHLKQLTNLHANKSSKEDCHFDWAELYDRAGHNLQDMVKFCRFGKETCNNSDFQTVVDVNK
ncbi:acid-sensing ion channel 4 isoform X1 [Arapaima gigas]